MSKFRLLLGTKNPGKVEEAREILAGGDEDLDLFSYRDREFSDVEETGDTYAENSLKKAREINEETGLPVLSDDSGLEVAGLDGAPGPRSARFAGRDATDEENLSLLLERLEGVNDREARFVTVATLFISPEERYMARGVLNGEIIRKPRGDSGFGYDPVFVPDGFKRTLAQLGEEQKNEISHRRKALEKVREELEVIGRRQS
ncbi:RdgB/HAM1 family non-canonical purine NTP pyrophosphatase [Candidatus Bipolaricaulota bacterium]|nr:RdgB/HAM1 family non-canonical purine NTP pyrophosphatase [Candidatus Bipolaricaulota bacterium]